MGNINPSPKNKKVNPRYLRLSASPFLNILAILVVLLLVFPFTSGVRAQQVEDFCTGPFMPVAIPLNDLGSQLYVRMDGQQTGEQGGLYSGGSNQRPSAHETAGVQIAAQVLPRSAQGTSDPTNGLIGMISIGMSNTAQEFGEFITLAEADLRLNPKLVLVNGAQAGQTANIWADPNSTAWQNLAARLAHAGLAPRQVQVAWIKNVVAGSGDFPAKPLALVADLTSIVRILKSRYPNVVIAYFSSRTRSYTYWQGLSPEPAAYESGFAVKWLIENQIQGAADLNYDPAHGTVFAPWLSWSAYLWADGVNIRSDGLTWVPQDMVTDCTHPSSNGELKVANLLLDFFIGDTTARWFTNGGVVQEHPIYLPLILVP